VPPWPRPLPQGASPRLICRVRLTHQIFLQVPLPQTLTTSRILLVRKTHPTHYTPT